MGIFMMTSNVQIDKIDPYAQQMMERVSYVNANQAHFGHIIGRWFFIANAANTLHQNDYVFSPPRSVSNAGMGHSTKGMADDGRFLWTISSSGTVRQVDPFTSTVVASYTLPASTYSGIAFDGRHFWIGDVTGGTIGEYDQNFTVIKTFTAPANTTDLHFMGRFLWVLTGVASGNMTIRQYDPNSGTEVGNFVTKALNSSESVYSITGNDRFLYTIHQQVRLVMMP